MNNVLEAVGKYLSSEQLALFTKTYNEKYQEYEKMEIYPGYKLTTYLDSVLLRLSEFKVSAPTLYVALLVKSRNIVLSEVEATYGNHTKSMLEALVKIDGVKENAATLIKFFGSMLNYCGRPDGDEILSSSSKTKEFVTKYFNHITVEQFYVFCLTKSNCVKKAFLINSGSTSEVNVQIRNITEKALETNCNRMIIAHNHPQGKAIMSGQDCRFTYSLLCSCILNNIELLDHIIVGTDQTISLYEQGILAKLKQKAAKTIQISDDNRLFVSEEPAGYEKSQSIPVNFDDYSF
jgi:DNA repair protein RadC